MLVHGAFSACYILRLGEAIRYKDDPNMSGEKLLSYVYSLILNQINLRICLPV